MSLPTLSIIIPVYNSEEYLDRCIKSILEQTIIPDEIILVNDGSTDNSEKICEYWSSQYPFIFYKTIGNSGPNNARYIGLGLSKGDFIGFLDSDDFIHPQMYQILLQYFEDSSVSIACCAYKMVSDIPLQVETDIQPGEIIPTMVSKDQAIVGLFRNNAIQPSLCNKIYRRKLFDKVESWHIHLRNNEDLLVNLQLFSCIEKMALCRLPLYYYFQRNLSASHRPMDTQMVNDFIFATHYIEDYLEKHNLPEKTISSIINERDLYLYTYILRQFNQHGKREVLSPFLETLHTKLLQANEQMVTDRSFSILQRIASFAVRFPTLYCLLVRLIFKD